LNRVFGSDAKKCEKYYVKNKLSVGTCGVVYPADGVVFTLEYDINKFPYFGFWVSEGGFRGDYNCAPEPSTGYYDSIDVAAKNGALPVLEPGERFEFGFTLTLAGM